MRGLEAIERNARVQTQLIADLLDVSRITSGKLTLDAGWFDPPETLEVSAGGADCASPRRGTSRIETDLEHASRQIWWDQARFQQVIWNLLDNAVKFSAAGGRSSSGSRARRPASTSRSRITGAASRAEFLPHVFERFRQEDSTTKRWHGGLGLGLAIVKHLVEAHGGSVSRREWGPTSARRSPSTFRPPRATRERRAPRREPPSDTSCTAVRVLVVEDDDDARGPRRPAAHARRMPSVRDVADVHAALASLDTFKPPLVVSDIGMPGRDGYDLIRQMRDSGHDAAALPAIALTAFAREEDSAKAMRAGYQRHIGKPVDANLLLRTAAELTRRA